MRNELSCDQSHQEACVLWRAGDIPVSEQIPEALKDQYITAVRFRSPSAWKVSETIIHRIAKFERQFEMKFRLAIRDFPLYSTVMSACYDGGSEAERALMFESLQRDSNLLDIRGSFRDVEINYSSLYLTGAGEIVLAAEPSDAAFIRRSSEELREIYEHYGLTPLFRDKLEIRIGRVAHCPPNEYLRGGLVHEIDCYLRYDLANKGLSLTTSNETISGSLYDFLA